MEMKVTDQAEVTIKLGVDFFSCALRLVGFALVRILTRWKIRGLCRSKLICKRWKLKSGAIQQLQEG